LTRNARHWKFTAMNPPAPADSRLLNRRETILCTGMAVAGLSLAGCV